MAFPYSTMPFPTPVFLAPHPIPTARPASFASEKRSFTASKVFLMPTPGPRIWPVLNGSPTSTAFRHRISQPSTPTRSARMSIIPSMAKFAWFEPNPRIAPAGGLFVYTARASTSTFGTR